MPDVLTDRLIKTAVKNRDKRIVLRDAVEPGLKLTIGGRTAIWAFETTRRTGGERRVVFETIGPIETISLAMARIEAKRIKGAIRAGIDPRAERTLAQARATTLGAEAECWQPKGRPKHSRNDRYMLKLALDEMGVAASAPEALTRRDLMRLLDMHAGRPATARHRLSSLRRFLDNLVHREILETNIVRLLPPGTQPSPPLSRAGYPNAGEVRALWDAADGLKPEHRDLMRLLFLAPLRRAEAAELVAEEVDLARAEIRLAGSRTKNRLPFTMPLSAAALAILTPRVGALDDPQARVFGPRRLDWWTVLKKWRHLASVPSFAPHDLRRLFASEAGEHRIGDFDLIDNLLSHSGSASRPGVSSVYQRSTRTAERRAVVERWANVLDVATKTGAWPREAAEKATVVRLRKRRRPT